MHIRIGEDSVRDNVEQFIALMRRVRLAGPSHQIPLKKVFRVWVNKGSGRILFSDSKPSSRSRKAEEWKAVTFSYQYNSATGELIFLAEDSSVTNAQFNGRDMAAGAFEVFQKTMKTFCEFSQRLKGPSDLDTKITVLSKMHIESHLSPEDRNMLFDAWHATDRSEAELLLMGKPAGTYLFRQDPFAKILEEQLSEQLQHKIKCFTVTYIERPNKFCDITLVHVDGTWLVYNDDPQLHGKKFADLKDFLHHNKTRLRFPFFRENQRGIA